MTDVRSFLLYIQAPEPEVNHMQATPRNLILLTSKKFLFSLQGMLNPPYRKGRQNLLKIS